MKKFMIFLLMAFLYIGTCQARSESAHPNDAQLKLLSWVSPTPDQSFMTRSVTDDVNLVQLTANHESVAVGEAVSLTLSPNGDAGIAAFYNELVSMGYTSLEDAYGDISVTWYVNGGEVDLGVPGYPLRGSFSTMVASTYEIKGVVKFGTHTTTYESNTISVVVGTSGDVTEVTEPVILTANTGNVVPGEEVNLSLTANGARAEEILTIVQGLGYSSITAAFDAATVVWYVDDGEGSAPADLGLIENKFSGKFSATDDGTYEIHAVVSFGPGNAFESNTISVEVATPETVSGLVLLTANPSAGAAVGQDVNLTLSPNGAAFDEILAAEARMGYSSVTAAYSDMTVSWYINGIVTPIGVPGPLHKLQGLFTPSATGTYQIKAVVSFGVYTYESNTIDVVVGTNPGEVEDLSAMVLLTTDPIGEVEPDQEVALTLSPNGDFPSELYAALSSLGYTTLEEAYNNAVVTWYLEGNPVALGISGNKLQGVFSSSALGSYEIYAVLSFGPGHEYESNTVTIVVANPAPPTVSGLVLLTANPSGEVAVGQDVNLTLSPNGAAFDEILAAEEMMGYSSLTEAYSDMTVTWYIDGISTAIGVSGPLHKLQGLFTPSATGTYQIKAVVSFGVYTYESNTIDVVVGTTPGELDDVSALVLLTAEPRGEVEAGTNVALTLSPNGDLPAELYAALSSMGYTTLEEAYNNAVVTWYVNGSEPTTPIGVLPNKLQGEFSTADPGTYEIHAILSFGPGHEYESNTVTILVKPESVSGLVLLTANPRDGVAVGQDVNLTLSPYGAVFDQILAAAATMGYSSLTDAYSDMSVTWYIDGIVTPIGVPGPLHKLQGLFTPSAAGTYQIKAVVSFGVYTYESNTLEVVVGDTPGDVEDLSALVLLTSDHYGEVEAGTNVALTLSPNGDHPAELYTALSSMGYTTLEEAYNNAVVTWYVNGSEPTTPIGVLPNKLQGEFSATDPGTYDIHAVLSFGPGHEYESNTVTIVVNPELVSGLVLLTANPRDGVAVGQDVNLTLSPYGAVFDQILAAAATMGYSSLTDAYSDMSVTWYIDGIVTPIGVPGPLHKLQGLFTPSATGTYQIKAVVSFGAYTYESNTLDVVVGDTPGDVEDLSALVLLTSDHYGEVEAGTNVALTLSPNGDHPAELYAALSSMGYTTLEEAYNNAVVTWYVNGSEPTTPIGVLPNKLQGEFSATDPGTYDIHAVLSFGPGHEYESNTVTIVVNPVLVSGLVLLTANPLDDVAVGQDVNLTLSPYGKVFDQILAAMATMGYTSLTNAYSDISVTWYIDGIVTPIGVPGPLHKLQGLFTPSVAGTYQIKAIVSFGGYAYESNTLDVVVGDTPGELEDLSNLILLTANPHGVVDPGQEVELVLSPNGDHPAELYAAFSTMGFANLEAAFNAAVVKWYVNDEEDAVLDEPRIQSDPDNKLVATFSETEPDTFLIHAVVEFRTGGGSKASATVYPYPSTKAKVIILGTPPTDACDYVEMKDISGSPVTSLSVPAESNINVELGVIAGYAATISDVEWKLDGAVVGNAENLNYTLPSTVTAGAHNIHVTYLVTVMGVDYNCEKDLPLTVTGEEPITPPAAVIFANIIGNTQVCENDEVTLTALVTGDANTVTNYVWLYKENPVGTGPIFTFVPSILFTDPDDHKIVLEVSNPEVCDKSRDSVEIEYLPDAPQIHIAISADTICVGGQITATIETDDTEWDLNLDNPIYNWYVNGVEVPGEHMGVITLNMPVAGAFGFAAMINTPMCGVSVQSEPDTVYVFDALPLTITGDNVICQNTSATMTATYYDNVTYAWAGPDPDAATTTDNELTTTIPGVYAVTATMDEGCFATAEFTIYQFGADLQVTADQMNVCPGTPVILNANLDGWFNENITYEWSDGLGNSPTVSTTVDETTTFTVTASVTDDEGHDGDCQLTSDITINVTATDTVTTDILSYTYNSYYGLGDTICVGEFVEIVAVSTPEGNYDYIWYVNGIEKPGQNLSDITLNFDEVGIYDIKAKAVVSGCTYSALSDYILINVEALPEVTISGNNVICDGNTATLKAVANTNVMAPEDDGSDYIYEYQWSNGMTGDEVPVTEAGVYTVTATRTTTGCFATASIEVSTFGGDLQVTADQMNVCPGTPVILNANLDGWNNENITYEWSDGLGTASTVSATVDATTTYTVTASTENAAACQLVSSITINVLPSETVTTTLIDPYVDNLCVGAENAFYVHPETAEHYVWYLDGIEIPGENNPMILLFNTDPGQHIIAAKAVVSGCQVATLSNDVVFYVHPVPEITISGNNVICSGNDAEITANAYNNTAYSDLTYTYSYNWSEGTNNPVLTTADAGTYNVTVTNQYDCQATASIEVTTFGGDLQVTADQMHVCPGTPVTLNANLDGWNNENITYEWSDGSTSSTISATVDATTTYTVTASTENATACQLISSITITATENENVVTTINADVTDVCVGGQIVLTATDDTYSYIWYKNGVEIPGENQPSITVTPTHNGIYTFAAKAVVSDCNTSEVSEPVEVNVIAAPVVHVTGTQSVVSGATSAELTVSVLPVGTYSYVWSEGSVDVEQISVSEAGVYNVTVTDANGCTAVSAPFMVNPISPFQIELEGPSTVCITDEVLPVTSSRLGDSFSGNLRYRWLANGQYIEGQTGPDFSMNPQDLYDIIHVTSFDLCLEITDLDNCNYITVQCKPIDITGQIIPDHIMVLNNGEEAEYVCEGAQLDLTIMVQGEDGETYEDPTLNYIWTRNGVVIPGVHTSSFSEQAWIYDGDPVNYVYTAYIDFGNDCVSEPVASTEINVRRNPIVTIDGNPNVCYEGLDVNNVVLVAWIDGGEDPTATYSWYESGQYRPNASGSDPYYVDYYAPSYDNPYIFTVEITNGNGCSAISEPFYVNVYDKPVVNITGDASTVCTDGGVTLQANLNNYHDPMLVYQWYENEEAPAHLIPGATHEIETFYPTEQTSYIAVVSHLMDYGLANCVGSDTFTVNITGIPQVTVEDDLDGATEICEGRSINFNATTTGGVEGEAIYTWYRNGELVENVTGSLYVDAPLTVGGVPTTYIYSVIVNQGLSGCESQLTYFDTITVNPNPNIQLVSDPIVCSNEGDNVVLTANMDVVATGVQYRWLEDNAEMAVTDEPTYSLHKDFSANPYNFSVQIVNDYGCTGEALATVYVNANPIVRLTTTDTMVCEGGTVTLAAALNDMNITDLTYQWYDGAEAINAATGSTYTVTSAELGTHEYHLVINQTTSGCQALSDTIILNVVSKPVIASVTEVNMPEDRTVCDGYQVNLTANVQGGVQGGETYTWYRNGVEVDDATLGTLADVLTAENGETTTYTYSVVVAQATSGCVSEIFVLDPITVNPNPVLQLVTNPIVCNNEGDNITLTANLNPEMEGATFRWLEDNVEMDPATYTANENSITLHKDYRYQPYSFSVELNSDFGCTAVGEALVYVNEAPVVNITASDTVLCEGGEMTLAASLNDWNATDLVYQWFDGTDSIAGATTLSYTFAPAAGVHNFHVHITQQSSGCEAESEVITVTVTDIPVIASVTTPQTSVCYGAQLAITAVPEGGNLAGDTYTWYRNGILMEGATAATIFDAPELVDNNMQQFVYTAVLTRPQPGCTSLPVTSDVVTVYPNPVVVITGDQHVCETDSIFLIANVDTFGMNVGGLHYTWYESGQIRDNMAYNLGDNNFFAEYMYARTEPYRFTVDVWRDDMGAGCISHSEEYLVYVYTQPVVNITATETQICTDGQVTLTANLNDYNATDLIYQWYTVGMDSSQIAVGYDENGGYLLETIYTPVYNNIPGATSATYTTNLTATTTLGVMVRQTTSNCWANDEITINVNSIPELTNIWVNSVDTPMVVCNGAEVTISADTIPEGIYTWYRNGIEIAGVNGPSFSENVYTDNENVTTYQYTAIVTLPASGCVSEMSANAGVVIVGNSPASVVVSGNNVICDGGYTTLYANVIPAQAATYQWFKDNTLLVESTDDNLVVETAGSYKVIAYFNGCSSVSDAVIVTVEAAPQLALTATESTICVGGATVITAEVNGWNHDNVNYTWSNGFTGSVFTYNADEAGIDTIVVTASLSTSGCVATDMIIINVNDVPAAPQIVVLNDVNTVCDGGQVTLQVGNAVPGATYEWYRNGVVISGANQSYLTESPVTVDGDITRYTYTAKAILPMTGCESEITDTADAAVVMVIPTPVAVVSVDGNTTLCAGGTTTTLHANVTPAGPVYTYQWYKDNVLIPGATEADYVPSENARETAYNYSVVVYANAGCSVTANAPAITFVAQPVVEATISNEVSCEGGSATLTAVVDGGVAGVNGINGYNFEWYKDGTLIGNTATITAYEIVGSYSYQVIVTSNYGCVSTSNTVNYTVVADPVVSIAVANNYPTTVCEGGSTAIKAVVVSDGNGDVASYQWYKNGNILVGETNQILNINSVSAVDTYSVDVIQTGVGCSGFASAAINTLVTVAPALTVSIDGFGGNVCEGGTFTLTAIVNNELADDDLSYQWFKIVNGNAVPVSGNPNEPANVYSTSDLLLGDSYDYYVVVTSSVSGCSVVSNSVPANVVAAPSVTINGANTVCEGGDLTLNAFVSGGVNGAAYTYTWSWTGPASGDTTITVPTFVPHVNSNDAAAPYYFTVTISRSDNSGCTATSAAHEVNVLSAPSVTITADNNTVCQNGNVTYTANVSPVGTYNYVWTVNGVQRPENASVITVPMSNVGTVNAIVEVSAAGASASCSATSANVSVQVVGAPTVTLALDNDQMSTMCVGGLVSLTATPSVNNVSGNFNYEWIVDGAPISGVINQLSQTLTNPGVHTYKVRVSMDNNLGCISDWSAPVTVQVAEQPVVTLTSADGLSICEGGSITMTGIVTNYGNTVNGVTNSSVYGALTFDWTRNGANVHHNTNVNTYQNEVTETLPTVGNYSYQVTVDAAGYNCLPQVSNTHVVNVVGDPSWTEVHVYSNNGTYACLGDMVTLTAAIQGGVADYNGSTGGYIQWVVTDENGNTANVSGGLGGSSYDLPTAAGTYTYTPTFVGNIGNGCQLTNTNAVQVDVTVHDLPTATFTSGDGTSICSNDPSASAALVIAFTGVAPFTYEVVDGHGNIVAHATTQASTATIYVAPTEQTTYRLTLIQDAYCENTSFGADAVATVYVNAIEFDNLVFESGCDNPGMVTINFTMISGNPTAAFNVVYDNGLQASGNISNNTATFAAPTTPGDYNAVFTVEGCSYDIVVRVLVGDFSFGGTLPIMDQRWNDVVVVNNNPTTNGGHVFVGFQWYRNGVAIPGATYSNYQEKGGLNGFYSVELIEQDANGNMVTYKTCEMYFNSVSTVKVYPVPANVRQEITIELDLTSEELDGAVLDIYSVTGAHINHVTDLRPITTIEGFNAQGTYFGRILTGTNEIKTVKFVIVK